MFYTSCLRAAKAPLSELQTSASSFKMPVRRTLHTDGAFNPPASKIPVPARNHKAQSGSKTGETKVTTHGQEGPHTELENLDSLRSKLEQSVDAFIKARKELEEIISAEGSSEQEHCLTAGSVTDLKTELRRHRELSARVESSLRESKDPRRHGHESVKMASSYHFLKSIMN